VEPRALVITNNSNVHNGARVDLHTVLTQRFSVQHEKPLVEVMGLKNAAKPSNHCLVRCRLPAEVDTDKVAHCTRIIKGLLNRQDGQVDPMLHTMDAVHAFKLHRRPGGDKTAEEHIRDFLKKRLRTLKQFLHVLSTRKRH